MESIAPDVLTLIYRLLTLGARDALAQTSKRNYGVFKRFVLVSAMYQDAVLHCSMRGLTQRFIELAQSERMHSEINLKESRFCLKDLYKLRYKADRIESGLLIWTKALITASANGHIDIVHMLVMRFYEMYEGLELVMYDSRYLANRHKHFGIVKLLKRIKHNGIFNIPVCAKTTI